MARLAGDILPLLMAASGGNMGGLAAPLRPDAAVVVVVASRGYPGAIENRRFISAVWLPPLPFRACEFCRQAPRLMRRISWSTAVDACWGSPPRLRRWRRRGIVPIRPWMRWNGPAAFAGATSGGRALGGTEV